MTIMSYEKSLHSVKDEDFIFYWLEYPKSNKYLPYMSLRTKNAIILIAFVIQPVHISRILSILCTNKPRLASEDLYWVDRLVYPRRWAAGNQAAIIFIAIIYRF